MSAHHNNHSDDDSDPSQSSNDRVLWTPDEDEYLLEYVRQYLESGTYSNDIKSLRWSNVSDALKTKTSKQCRERYTQLSNPSASKQTWTDAEDLQIIELHRTVGTKWTEFARVLHGRPENSIKNRWNSTTRRVARYESQIKKQGITAIRRDIEEQILFKYCRQVRAQTDPTAMALDEDGLTSLNPTSFGGPNVTSSKAKKGNKNTNRLAQDLQSDDGSIPLSVSSFPHYTPPSYDVGADGTVTIASWGTTSSNNSTKASTSGILHNNNNNNSVTTATSTTTATTRTRSGAAAAASSMLVSPPASSRFSSPQQQQHASPTSSLRGAHPSSGKRPTRKNLPLLYQNTMPPNPAASSAAASSSSSSSLYDSGNNHNNGVYNNNNNNNNVSTSSFLLEQGLNHESSIVSPFGTSAPHSQYHHQGQGSNYTNSSYNQPNSNNNGNKLSTQSYINSHLIQRAATPIVSLGRVASYTTPLAPTTTSNHPCNTTTNNTDVTNTNTSTSIVNNNNNLDDDDKATQTHLSVTFSGQNGTGAGNHNSNHLAGIATIATDHHHHNVPSSFSSLSGLPTTGGGSDPGQQQQQQQQPQSNDTDTAPYSILATGQNNYTNPLSLGLFSGTTVQPVANTTNANNQSQQHLNNNTTNTTATTTTNNNHINQQTMTPTDLRQWSQSPFFSQHMGNQHSINMLTSSLHHQSAFGAGLSIPRGPTPGLGSGLMGGLHSLGAGGAHTNGIDRSGAFSPYPDSLRTGGALGTGAGGGYPHGIAPAATPAPFPHYSTNTTIGGLHGDTSLGLTGHNTSVFGTMNNSMMSPARIASPHSYLPSAPTPLPAAVYQHASIPGHPVLSPISPVTPHGSRPSHHHHHNTNTNNANNASSSSLLAGSTTVPSSGVTVASSHGQTTLSAALSSTFSPMNGMMGGSNTTTTTANNLAGGIHGLPQHPMRHIASPIDLSSMHSTTAQLLSRGQTPVPQNLQALSQSQAQSVGRNTVLNKPINLGPRTASSLAIFTGVAGTTVSSQNTTTTPVPTATTTATTTNIISTGSVPNSSSSSAPSNVMSSVPPLADKLSTSSTIPPLPQLSVSPGCDSISSTTTTTTNPTSAVASAEH